jgi:hypothetical protein
MALQRRAYTRPPEAFPYSLGLPFGVDRGYGTGRKPWRVGGSQRCALKVSGVSPPGAAVGADLGGSSKYSSEILEDRSGEGFHVNSS